MGKTDKKKDKKGKTPVIPSLPDVHGDDDDMELSDEDLEFVKQQVRKSDIAIYTLFYVLRFLASPFTRLGICCNRHN